MLDGSLDVIIVGAGAAGIGCAFTLTHIFGLDPSRVLLLESGARIDGELRNRLPLDCAYERAFRKNRVEECPVVHLLKAKHDELKAKHAREQEEDEAATRQKLARHQ